MPSHVRHAFHLQAAQGEVTAASADLASDGETLSTG